MLQFREIHSSSQPDAFRIPAPETILFIHNFLYELCVADQDSAINEPRKFAAFCTKAMDMYDVITSLYRVFGTEYFENKKMLDLGSGHLSAAVVLSYVFKQMEVYGIEFDLRAATRASRLIQKLLIEVPDDTDEGIIRKEMREYMVLQRLRVARGNFFPNSYPLPASLRRTDLTLNQHRVYYDLDVYKLLGEFSNFDIYYCFPYDVYVRQVIELFSQQARKDTLLILLDDAMQYSLPSNIETVYCENDLSFLMKK